MNYIKGRNAVRVLKEHDVWQKFMNNYYQHPNDYNTGNVLADLEHACSITHHFLNSGMIGFWWTNTNEGDEFWMELNKNVKIVLEHD